ncbi:MAG: VWA domain-containing protein [Propionibacteriaceae bacterium]|nr:VWA domain-containing protein [Propionibacteriaceae bacterium]
MSSLVLPLSLPALSGAGLGAFASLPSSLTTLTIPSPVVTALEIGFMRPERLWALLAVPILLVIYFGLTLARHSRTKQQASNLSILFPKRQAWKRHIAVVAAIASLGSLTLAWAMPNGFIEVPRDRATVFLVIDVSNSMAATDIKPSRLEAAQEAAIEFVDELPSGYNISLVSFSGTAQLLVPPTSDRGQATAAISKLTLGPSTAIGEGIYTALDAVSLIPPDPDDPDEKPGVAIVVLSDGDSNIGRSSIKAAEEAKEDDIAVSTIAYGTPYGVIDTPMGPYNVGVNTGELEDIADVSGGHSYSAESLDQLREVYQDVARTVGYELEEDEITERFVGFAIILAVISVLGLMSLAARWP